MARHRSIVALALPLVLLLVAALGGGCGPMAASSLAEQGLRKARAGKYDKALATCEEALQLNPRDYRAYNSRGTTYYLRNGAGDFDRAIADFGEAIRLAPTNADAYYNRAVVYRDRGDGERAEADETKARDLDVEMKETYAQLPAITPPAGAAPTGQTSLDGKADKDQPQSASEKVEEYEEFLRLRDKWGSKKVEKSAPLGGGLGLPAGSPTGGAFGQPPSRTRDFDSDSNSSDETYSPFGEGRPLPSSGVPSQGVPLPLSPPALGSGGFLGADDTTPSPRLPSDLAPPTDAKKRTRAPSVRMPALPRGQYGPDEGTQTGVRRPIPTPFPQYQPRPAGIPREVARGRRGEVPHAVQSGQSGAQSARAAAANDDRRLSVIRMRLARQLASLAAATGLKEAGYRVAGCRVFKRHRGRTPIRPIGRGDRPRRRTALPRLWSACSRAASRAPR